MRCSGSHGLELLTPHAQLKVEHGLVVGRLLIPTAEGVGEEQGLDVDAHVAVLALKKVQEPCPCVVVDGQFF